MGGITGFIGVGSQGGPMAHRIVDAGMPLVVWARRPEALAAYVAKGATAAATVAELGAACDHVGVCVVNDADVVQICDQLIPAMRPGSRIAIHSTVLPETCAELARLLAHQGEVARSNELFQEALGLQQLAQRQLQRVLALGGAMGGAQLHQQHCMPPFL